jgi:DNA-directed RNA polymerase subunit H (RpoH/RPB5)
MKILSLHKKRPKRKSLSSSEKQMMLNVYQTELKLNPNILTDDFVSKAAYFTGVSESFIFRVMREYKTTHILKSPKKFKLRKKISESVDEFPFAMNRLVPLYWFSTQKPIRL